MVANFQRLCGIQADGSISNQFLNYYFWLASTTGEEIFGLIPVLFWVSFPVAVSFITNFLVLMMVGQLTKDFFMLPRPSTTLKCKNPIIKLDTKFETEFGLPSTHTMSGFLPMVVLLSLQRHGIVISTLAWICGFFYIISVALSRVYLGVHSIYDLLAGGVLGAGLTYLLHLYGDVLDIYLYQKTSGIYIICVLFVMFLTMYPRNGPWSSSYGTSAQVFGTWSGCAASLWYVFNCNAQILNTVLKASVVVPRDYFNQSSSSSNTTFFSYDDMFISPSSLLRSSSSSLSEILSSNISSSNSECDLTSEVKHNISSTMRNDSHLTTNYWSTDELSFNNMPIKVIVCRILASFLLVGLTKVVMKILPAILFNSLYKYKFLRPPLIEEKDCFGRDVPQAKAYVVEVPVRLVNYIGLAVATILLCPLSWQFMIMSSSTATSSSSSSNSAEPSLW